MLGCCVEEGLNAKALELQALGILFLGREIVVLDLRQWVGVVMSSR
jgi:hypothetical protein